MSVSRETAAERDTVSTEYERRLEQQARNLCRWRRWAREYRRVTGRQAGEPVYLFTG